MTHVKNSDLESLKLQQTQFVHFINETTSNLVHVIYQKKIIDLICYLLNLARMEEGRSAFKILTDKSTGKIPLGRPRRRWEDNIRMDLEEIGNNANNWVDSAQDRNYWRALVNAALNLRVP